MSGRPLFVTQGFLNVLPDNFGSYRFGHFHRKGRKVFFFFLAFSLASPARTSVAHFPEGHRDVVRALRFIPSAFQM